MKKSGNRKVAGKLAGMLLAALCTAAVSGCGSTSGSTYEAAMDTAAVTMAEPSDAAGFGGTIYENAAAAEFKSEESGDGQSAAEVMPEEYEAEQSASNSRNQNRKLIKTVDMSVETEEFDLLISNVEKRVEELGGYVEQSNVYNGSYTSNYRSRSASITARIPAEQLDLFVTDVAEQSNVIRKNESVDDVTLQYVDLESHKKALLAEQESLLAMLEKAESLEDIITINAQLTDVRYQLESMESQLRTYDNKINYSTVYLNVEEVEQYEPYVTKSTSERISEGFVRNLRRVGDGISNFFIELVIALPLIVTAAVVIGIFVLVIYVLIKSGEKRAAKRRERMQAQNPGMYNRYGMKPPAPRAPYQGPNNLKRPENGMQNAERTGEETDGK